jgi:hypothetical protein
MSIHPDEGFRPVTYPAQQQQQQPAESSPVGRRTQGLGIFAGLKRGLSGLKRASERRMIEAQNKWAAARVAAAAAPPSQQPISAFPEPETVVVSDEFYCLRIVER